MIRKLLYIIIFFLSFDLLATNTECLEKDFEHKLECSTNEFFSKFAHSSLGDLGLKSSLIQNLMICSCVPSESISIRYDDKMNYNEVYDLKDGDTQKIGIHEITATKINNDICLYSKSLHGNKIIACKKIAPSLNKQEATNKCNIATSCFDESQQNTLNALSLSGYAVQCIGDSIDRVFYNEEKCEGDSQAFSLFVGFKDSMRKLVTVTITIYVMIFGFKVLLGREAVIKKSEIVILIFKVILVFYFSVGLKGTDGIYRDGISEHAAPLFKAASNSFASYILKAGGVNGLCDFQPDEYENGYGHLALWDSLDCKISYYLFLFNPAPTVNNDTVGGVPELLVSILLLIFTRWFFIALLVIIMFIFVMSAALYFVHHFILCMIALTFTLFLAPLFVPMALFNQTKQFYDKWLKLAVSYSLQPVIVAAFLALMLTVYDQAIYDDCEFERSTDSAPYNFQFKDASDDCKKSLGYLVTEYLEDSEKDNFTEKFFSAWWDAITKLFLFSFLFYYFSTVVGNFAADITFGSSVSAFGGNPTKLVDKAKSAAMLAIDAKTGGMASKAKGTAKRSGIKGAQS